MQTKGDRGAHEHTHPTAELSFFLIIRFVCVCVCWLVLLAFASGSGLNKESWRIREKKMNGRKVVVVCWWLNDIFHFSEYYKIAEKHTNKVLAVVFGPTIAHGASTTNRKSIHNTQSLQYSSRICCPSFFHGFRFPASLTHILFLFPFFMLSLTFGSIPFCFLFCALWLYRTSTHNFSFSIRTWTFSSFDRAAVEKKWIV